MRAFQSHKYSLISNLNKMSYFSSFSAGTGSYTMNLCNMDKLNLMVDSMNVNQSYLSSLSTFCVNNVDVGLITGDFCSLLHRKNAGLIYDQNLQQLTFKNTLTTNENKTEVLHIINSALRDEGHIEGWRNEQFAVSPSFPPLVTLPKSSTQQDILIERSAAAYYGTNAYGIHLNGFTRNERTGLVDRMWVAKRAHTKATWPGKDFHPTLQNSILLFFISQGYLIRLLLVVSPTVWV